MRVVRNEREVKESFMSFKVERTKASTFLGTCTTEINTCTMTSSRRYRHGPKISRVVAVLFGCCTIRDIVDIIFSIPRKFQPIAKINPDQLDRLSFLDETTLILI